MSYRKAKTLFGWSHW